MPKMGKGKQVKVFIPTPLYKLLKREANHTGRPMAEIMREEIADRYQDQLVAESVVKEEVSATLG